MTLPTVGDIAAVAATFRLLGDVTRLRILYQLLDTRTLKVGELAARIEVAESAVSHSLRLLRMAGIVASERQGRTRRYRLADDHVRTLLEVARSHASHSA